MLSVVIPVRNGAHTIRRAVDSVVAQAAGDIEFIVVDDGSIDDPAAAISDHIEAGVVTLVRTDGIGVAAARNLGVERSRGAIVAFLDADDHLEPSWASTLTDLMNRPATGLASCGAVFRTERREEIRRPEDMGAAFDHRIALLLAGTFCVRRRVWDEAGGYDVNLRFGENTELGLRLCEALDRLGLGTAWTSEPLLVSERRPFEHHRPDAVAASAALVLERHAPRLASDPTMRRRYLAVQGVCEARVGRGDRARRSLREAWLTDPRDGRALLRYAVSIVPGAPAWVWGEMPEARRVLTPRTLDPATVDLSVIVSTASDDAHQVDLLETLAVDDPPAGGWELVVVGAAARGLSGQWSDRLPLRYVQSGSRSLCEARNVGARASLGRSMVFIDSGDSVEAGFLRSMAASLDQGFAAAPRLRFEPPARTGVRHLGHEVQQRHLPEVDGVPWAHGSGVGVRRTAFFAIGGFDERLRRCADVDLSLRLANAGYRLEFVDAAVLRCRVDRGVPSTLREEFDRGIDGARLHAKWRGITRPSAREVVSLWLTSVRLIVFGPTAADRTGGLLRLVNRVGRVRGAITYKVPHA